MTLTPLAPGRGSGAPSTAGRSQRCAPSVSDILLALAAKLDGAIVGKLAGGEQDLLLCGFDVALEHFAGALRHVLEDLGLEGLVRTLERDEQFVGGNLAKQLLHATVVDLQQV